MAPLPKVTAASVLLWGEEVGAVAWNDDRSVATFQYTPDFARSGLEVAPLLMPLSDGRIYSFPALNRITYYGLPGLLADALPDRFGNRLIDIWLTQHGRAIDDFSPVERLCYMGTRAMGALEFKPAVGPRDRKAVPIEIGELTRLAADVLNERMNLVVNLDGADAAALKRIIQVGTSAGGARAKAVIAWNPDTDEVRSGQVPAPQGFEPWLLKFDGVNRETLGDPEGYGRIEYAYYEMAIAAGVKMSNCRLHEEGGRAHFMTRRFDRGESGRKIHVQSLCAMSHFDFNAPGYYSYEQAFGAIQELNLGHPTMQEMYRRMIFNVLARNQDDHTRNIAFLMGETGEWRLAPAFDVTWRHRPDSRWVGRHQMRIQGKQDHFTSEDLLGVADQFGIRGAKDIFGEVRSAVSRWPEFAALAGVPTERIKKIGETHRKVVPK